MLAFVGCPAGEPLDFKSCRDAVCGGVGKGVLIDRRRLGKQGAGAGVAQSGGKGVLFAHGAEVGHQVKQITVKHLFRIAVGHRQGEPSALDQRPQIADFGHGQDAGRQTARNLRLGLGQRGAQFMQGLAAEQAGQQQSIGAKGAAALDKLAHGIIGPMQAKRMDHQILRAGFQLQRFVIRHDPRLGEGQGPRLRPGRYNGDGRERFVNLDESFLNFGDDLFQQKQGRAHPCGAGAVKGKAGAVGQLGGHDAVHRVKGVDMAMQAALKPLIRAIYPPQCLTCDALVSTEFGLCADCWRETPFIRGLVCDQCGVPLPGEDDGRPVQCDDCLAVARPWGQGRAALLYEGNGRKLVLGLKHADRLDLARPAGEWLLRAAGPMLRADMLVAPIPLHWFRLIKRRYNQAGLLSGQVARLAGLEHCPDLLVRRRYTGSQDGKSREGRFQNVDGAIVLHRRHGARVAGRHVLLVDDVMTSGATFAAAAEACLAQGATGISVLALARVAKGA